MVDSVNVPCVCSPHYFDVAACRERVDGGGAPFLPSNGTVRNRDIVVRCHKEIGAGRLRVEESCCCYLCTVDDRRQYRYRGRKVAGGGSWGKR